jgi:hypothetical protein
VLRDIHARAIQMWAGLHLGADLRGDDAQAPHVVTLEENLEMAATSGLDATTSLDDALAPRSRARRRREGRRAPVRAVPAAAQRRAMEPATSASSPTRGAS